MGGVDTDGILTANGIQSLVQGPEKQSLGHVLLLDYDEAYYPDVHARVQSLDGITAILESSPDSYHVWNLSIRPKDQTALKGLAYKCDPAHVSVGYRRYVGWTLRVTEKDSVNSADSDSAEGSYRSAPEYVDAWATTTERAQSAPHFNVLLGFMPMGERRRLCRAVSRRDLSFTGSHYHMERYLTLSDEVKDGV